MYMLVTSIWMAELHQVGENICDVSGACADLFESMVGPQRGCALKGAKV